MTCARHAAMALALLLGLSACAATGGITFATKPCGENVGPDYSSFDATEAGPPGQFVTPSRSCS